MFCRRGSTIKNMLRNVIARTGMRIEIEQIDGDIIQMEICRHSYDTALYPNFRDRNTAFNAFQLYPTVNQCRDEGVLI